MLAACTLRNLIGAALLSLAAHSAAAPGEFSVVDRAGLDARVDAYVDDGHLPLLFVRVEDAAGRPVYERGRAHPRLLPGAPPDGDSWFRIWSMSKIVTIAVVLDLVEDGLLALDDPVDRYVPEFAQLEVAVAPGEHSTSVLAPDAPACPLRTVPALTTMTVEHLLNHEAGFWYPWTGIDCLDAALVATDLLAAADSDDLIARLARLPLVAHPGARYHYGTGTTVLGLVAERVTGRSLDRLVRERLTGPLGIEALLYRLPAGATLPPYFSGADGALRAAGANELDIFGGRLPQYGSGAGLFLGGEGMVATTEAYADFLQMLLHGGAVGGVRVLHEASIAALHAPRTQLENPYGYNGYNLWVTSGRQANGQPGQPGLWTGGGYEGTYFWIDPQLGLVGLIMTQVFAVPAGAQHRNDEIRNAFYDRLRIDNVPALNLRARLATGSEQVSTMVRKGGQ